MIQILNPIKIKRMKKFNYFLLFAVTLFFTILNLNAFATSQLQFVNAKHVEKTLPNKDCVNSYYAFNDLNYNIHKLEASSSNSKNLMPDKLTILYSICLALVLFNLVAQIKIIIQMIQLFSLFKKKDEAMRINI